MSINLLFLDDEEWRHLAIEKELRDKDVVIQHVYNASDAIEQLDKERFNIVMLDHDLGDFKDENSGMVVVDYMCTNLPEDHKTTKVFVHSWNTPRGQEMVKRLTEAGFSAVYTPFEVK